MNLRKMVFVSLLATSASSFAAADPAGPLYCVGASSPADRPYEKTPADAILAVSGSDARLEIRGLGRGEKSRVPGSASGFETTGRVALTPAGGGASYEVAFVLQNYTGELKVHLVEDKPGPQKVIYQGKCEAKKSLVDLHG